ncbi:MAG: mechanosensitive ion channel, partial [bacterium]|nr:mechanosensitive ion channel [bacterium]
MTVDISFGMRQLLVLLLALGCFGGWAGPAFGEPEADSTAPEDFPGLAEVVPRASIVLEEAGKVEENLKTLQETGKIEEKIAESRREIDAVLEKTADSQELGGLSSDGLLSLRDRLTRQKNNAVKELETLSQRLASLEALRKEWTVRANFWKDWWTFLRGQNVAVPEETFKNVEKTITQLLGDASQANTPLVELQQKVTVLLDDVNREIAKIDGILTDVRKEIFKKNSRSLVSRGFFSQFDTDLWASFKKGIFSSWEMEAEFFFRHSWLIALQLITAIGLALLILKNRKSAEGIAEWQYLFQHPWAPGTFFAVSTLSWLYLDPPGLWRLALWVLATLSFSVLISGLVRNPLKRLTVYLLAFLFVVTLALQILSVPVPLYRIYVAAVSLAGLVFLWALERKSVQVQQGKISGFTLLVRIGGIIVLATLVTQVAGYSALSFRLIESSVATIFIILLVAMVIRLGQAGIDFIMGHPLVTRKKLVPSLKNELRDQLKALFRGVVVVFTFLYLLIVWGFFGSVPEAWDRLTGFSFQVGTVTITVGVILLAGLVFYGAFLVSLALRSFLESQVFPRQRFDRGVRNSINKLLHYFLIFVGFLLAVSLAGIEMKNFAVLAGAFGIGIGFGLQNIVNNFVSGIILLFERPIKVGDLLVLDGEWGTVRAIGLRSTVVETLDQSEIIVPNSQLIQEKVTNWTFSTSMSRVVAPVGVAYG